MAHRASVDVTVPRALLSVADLEPASIRGVLDLAGRLRGRWSKPPTPLHGMAIAAVFEKPSLRTRASFEIGLTRLGAHVVYMDQAGSPLGERESIRDFARTLERYADATVARVRSHASLEELAEHTRRPLINALSDLEHPCQALGDALTIHVALGGVTGVRVAFIGDGNNVCHSLLLVLGALGGHATVISPSAYGPQAMIVERARTLANASGGSITLSTNPEAVAGHDVIYTDTWVSMGSEAEREERVEAFQRYRVTAELMRHAGSGGRPARFMHCLPACRGVEVDDEVIDGQHSIVYDQAENRMHAQNALAVMMLDQHRPQ
ncbi:MAG: ornithine carbamoyltransferase [Planctomycetota bacterium]